MVRVRVMVMVMVRIIIASVCDGIGIYYGYELLIIQNLYDDRHSKCPDLSSN